MKTRNIIISLAIAICVSGQASAATTQKRYFAHEAVEDQYGVIAPWYRGQNGQFDFRVGVAAETLKRYPWVGKNRAVLPAPEYVYDGKWHIDPNGTITVLRESDWQNGDMGQRSGYLLSGMIAYYQYSGDPMAFAVITATANYLVGHCETGPNHGWPHMLISVPNMGSRYGDCRLGASDVLRTGHSPAIHGNGKIQLDIVAEVGLQLVRAYEMTGNTLWYNAAKHWADLLAANRRHEPGISPWGRYADNSNGNGMNGIQTGGVVSILQLFDELIRTGYTGPHNSLIAARDAGRSYLRNVLLPAWTVDNTWAYNYWDWEDNTQGQIPTAPVAMYLMDHKDVFPNWRDDIRDILSLFLNRTSANPLSMSDTYSGAWAYPESTSCCNRSLSYPPMRLGGVFARYAVEAHSEWARELTRRSEILATYDALPNGQAIDDIDGGSPVDGNWFKIAQPMPLRFVLEAMGWLPDIMGANRENHIMRSSGVIQQVIYDKGAIRYSTFDASGAAIDVLRLAFAPTSITADGRELTQRSSLTPHGYMVQKLSGGDCIVTIRHDHANNMLVTGPDPQKTVDGTHMTFEGEWQTIRRSKEDGGSLHVTTHPGASTSYAFVGNQVRLIGSVGEAGGQAAVYVDGIRQLAPIGCYSPIPMSHQVIYYKNGLSNAGHIIKVVAEGETVPASKGNKISIEGVQYSNASGDSGFGEGGGPTDTQRMIFGYTDRKGYIDSQGNIWRPGTEFTSRVGHATDPVAKTWRTMRQALSIAETADPELYRYGVHWSDFTVNVTVGPGTYHVRLKFAETQYNASNQRGITAYINDQRVISGFDVFATAGRADKAVDLVYDNIKPIHGIIAIRFVGSTIGDCQHDAMVQAIEVGPGKDEVGAQPKSTKAFE